MILGWVEVIIGVMGIGLGMAQKMARSSVVIAVGLIIMGLSRLIGAQAAFLSDIGAFLILLGLGMSIAVAIHQWRKK